MPLQRRVVTEIGHRTANVGVSKTSRRLDKNHGADNSNGEAKQHARVVTNISGAAEEGGDLSSWCTIGAVAARSSSVGASASSAGSTGGADFIAAVTAWGGRGHRLGRRSL